MVVITAKIQLSTRSTEFAGKSHLLYAAVLCSNNYLVILYRIE